MKARQIERVLALIAAIFAETHVFAEQGSGEAIQAPSLKDFPILTEKRLQLTREYARLHFGIDSAELSEPRMIVVHDTAIAGLSDSLATFKPDLLTAGRTDIAGHGDLNVGVHYLIAADGAIYRLLPETVMGRHVIGFNWCAIGIEMVARTEKNLTPAQLASCARLVAWIASRHPTIRYLIGHHEYMKGGLPHSSLFIEKDPSYLPTAKSDPGDTFMRELRGTLANRYALRLLD
jgi:hypothetical protein